MKFKLSDRFEKNLPSDPLRENTRRQVVESCFSYVTPQKTNAPKMLHFSEAMGEKLGLTVKDLHSEEFLNVFTGNALIPNSSPYAMCYGGHQFGNWAGQLGDGRAINLAEVEHNNAIGFCNLKVRVQPLTQEQRTAWQYCAPLSGSTCAVKPCTIWAYPPRVHYPSR